MIPDNIQYVPIAWYHRKEYKKLRALFADGRDLPLTFDQWLKKAKRIFKDAESQGHTVVKVYIEIVPFQAWCNKRGLNIDKYAREKFATEFVFREYIKKN